MARFVPAKLDRLVQTKLFGDTPYQDDLHNWSRSNTNMLIESRNATSYLIGNGNVAQLLNIVSVSALIFAFVVNRKK